MFGSSSGGNKSNPSPNRTSIKEANDHLQLLHHRVNELQRTIQEQADALIKKDEYMQCKIMELVQLKDVQIQELVKSCEDNETRIKALERVIYEKDQQIEMLTQKCAAAEEVATFIPVVERLLYTIKKIPSKTPHRQGNLVTVRNKSHSSHKMQNHKGEKRNSSLSLASVDGPGSQNSSTPDDHISGAGTVQAMADLKIRRSFQITSNFSMSEDEGENS